MIRVKDVADISCDNPGCNNKLEIRNNKIPGGWVVTSASASTRALTLYDSMSRQILGYEGGMHFCCLGCFNNYGLKQIERYLGLINNKENKDG